MADRGQRKPAGAPEPPPEPDARRRTAARRTTARRSATPAQDNARLEALFASIGEGIITTDETGAITRVNQAALDLLDLGLDDALGHRFLDIVIETRDNGTPVAPFDRPILRAVQLGRTVHARTLYRRHDGTLLPVQVTVAPIILHGQPAGMVDIFRDLTAEIENDKLKSDFISIASHQLRTPLSAINMYTRMLQDGLAGGLSEQQLGYVRTILGSAERMNSLIDTLLNVTRAEAGGIVIRPRVVQLDELAREILDEFIPAARAKNLTLTAELPTGMAPVHADSLLIKEICANLLSNAVKYTPDGGRVTFVLSETPDELHWSVSDTGYGIPASDQPSVFLKFFRARNIVSRDVSGTGLGLYLIKNIAEALGGELWFESTEDVGSTFHFSLPRQALK